MLTLSQPFVTEERALWTNPNGPRAVTTYIVIHHAAAVYAPGKAVRAIYDYHTHEWPDYHAAAYAEIIQIEADGAHLGCHLMYHPEQIGAGVWGHNGDTFHICAATNFVGMPDDAFVEALAQRAAAAKSRYPSAQIVGHKEIALPGHETACPGQLWAVWKPRLLKRVAAILAPTIQTYRVAGLPIYHDSQLLIPTGETLPTGAPIDIDATAPQSNYASDAAHRTDATGGGFLSLSGLVRT